MTGVYEIKAFLEDDKETRTFYLRISGPFQEADGEDYYCKVHAPVLFNRDKKIYGADEKQAKILAIKFLKQMLGNMRLIDKDGNLIDLEDNMLNGVSP